MAVSVPSRRAPMRYVCRVCARWPVATPSLRRSLKTRTARPAAARERYAAIRPSVVGALLRAEAAAHELARHVHAVGIELEGPRELLPRVPDALCRDEGVQLVAEPLRDGAVRLERVMHLRRGARTRPRSIDVGLDHAGLDVAALVLDRILLQALVGERLGEVDDEAERRVARRERRDGRPCAGARPRTRAPRPARPRSPAPLVKIALRSSWTSSSAGDSTACTPGTARAASTSSSTVACACGERTTTPWSMPGSAMSET